MPDGTETGTATECLVPPCTTTSVPTATNDVYGETSPNSSACFVTATSSRLPTSISSRRSRAQRRASGPDPLVAPPSAGLAGSASIANSSPRARAFAVCARFTRASTRMAWPAPSRGRMPGTTSLAASVPQVTVNACAGLATSSTAAFAIAARSSAGTTKRTVPPVDAASCVSNARAGAGPTPITWIGTPSFLPATSTAASSATRPSLTTTIGAPSGRAASSTRERSRAPPLRCHAVSMPRNASAGADHVDLSTPSTAIRSAGVSAPNSARTIGCAVTFASPCIVAARSRTTSMRSGPFRGAGFAGASTTTAA